MDVYGTKKIRNVVLLGHGGAGKTTVAEALAYLTGVTKRMGKVADGNTISDYDKEEIKRQFSISTTLIPIEYEGAEGKVKINLLDTPGYFDFVGEVEEAVSVADAAIIVVNCKAGIEVGTEKAWELCEEYRLPRMIFVTNMDDDHASFRELILKMEKRFGRKIAPFQVPIRENEKFVGFVNVVKMAGRRFTNFSDYEECEIPEYTKKNLGIIRDALIEAVAETSEEYMERYFSGEEFTQDEIYTAVQTHVCEGSIVPVMMGSGINCQGFQALLNAIDRYFPAPDAGECIGVDVSTGERFTAKYNEDVSLSARVFKTVVDPFIGKYSLMKICTGVLKPDSTIYNVNKDAEEKVAKVYVLRGKDVIEVPELKAGDIGAVAKLAVTQTGDTIALRSAPIVYHKPKISTPYTYMRYAAKTKGDEDKISSALARMMEEDLTLRVVNDSENRQSLLYGIGDQQLEDAFRLEPHDEIIRRSRAQHRRALRIGERSDGIPSPAGDLSGEALSVELEEFPAGEADFDAPPPVAGGVEGEYRAAETFRKPQLRPDGEGVPLPEREGEFRLSVEPVRRRRLGGTVGFIRGDQYRA